MGFACLSAISHLQELSCPITLRQFLRVGNQTGQFRADLNETMAVKKMLVDSVCSDAYMFV